MIALREHNDIVQKLMKELTEKERELKDALKERNKPTQAPQLEPTANEKQLNARINQLNKEYKDKISTLTQQLRSKSTQNKELKERLTTRSNMEAKQKDHIAQLMRKNIDRKPSSAHDHKVAALISHYDAEINKKTKFIQSLQKQLREAQQKQRNTTQQDENCKDVAQNEPTKGVSLVEHQRELGRAKIEAAKQKRLFQEKDKQYRDLSRRYTQLTNEYYKIINAYGLQQDNQEQTNTHSRTLLKAKSTEGIPQSRQTLKGKLKTNALHNLLQEMAGSDTEHQNTMMEDEPRQINVKPTKIANYQEEGQEAAQESLALSKLEEIIALLSLSDPAQIIPVLSRMKIQNGEYQLADTICRSLQAFLYNIGKGKLPRDQLVSSLEEFQQSYNRNLQAVDFLDELCIAVGAKREKVNEKVQELIRIRGQYYQQLKSLKYTQELSKANKVAQFIEFFQLDREQLALPQQLIVIQEQLKAINKYTKEVRAILQIDADKSPQMVLELALRYMEKSTAFMAQYQRKNKPKNQ